MLWVVVGLLGLLLGLLLDPLLDLLLDPLLDPLPNRVVHQLDPPPTHPLLLHPTTTTPPNTDTCSNTPRLFIPKDMVQLFAHPAEVRPGDYVLVEVAYSSRIETAEKILVVQLRDSSLQLLMTEYREVSHLDSACIEIFELYIPSSLGVNEPLVLETWIVNKRMYEIEGDMSWKYALDRADTTGIKTAISTQY